MPTKHLLHAIPGNNSANAFVSLVVKNITMIQTAAILRTNALKHIKQAIRNWDWEFYGEA